MIQTADLSPAASGAAQAMTVAGSGASSSTGTSTTSTSASGTNISSNDFLTLLVTEMKNQDPTQPTDPNAYIQQLVGVNSLQQLIAINNDLSASTSTSTGSVSAPAAAI